MIIKKIALIICSFVALAASVHANITITQTPLCEVVTPDTLYAGKPLPAFFTHKRSRFATCGGVAWFHDNKHLATTNFEGGFISTYVFDATHNQCTPLQVIHGSQDNPLKSAELLAFSPDGTLLAVGVNHTSKVIIYAVDTITHEINPIPILTIPQDEDCVHGVRFSNDNNYLACSTVHGNRVINCYALSRKPNTVHAQITSTLQNAFLGLRPKSLDFTKDDRFIAVVCSANNVKIPHEPGGLIAVYAFDKTTGIINPTIISVYKNNAFMGGEDVTFSTNDSSIIISEQATNKITIIGFDKETGQLEERIGGLENPAARLNVPHGITLSSDGQYLAVTNYGDDKFSIYHIDKRK